MKDADALAIALLGTPEMAAARADVEALYEADPNAASPLARARIPSAVAEFATASAHTATFDPFRPELLWVQSPGRSYRGLTLPGSRFGTDNPDNVYRNAAVAPGLSYRIDGQFADTPPTAFTLSLLDGYYTETSHIKTLGVLSGDKIRTDERGRFTITIDSEPAGDRPNHIQITPGAKLLFSRETLCDWSRELPSRMTMTRVDDTAAPPPLSPPELAVRAAHVLRAGAPFWALKFQHDSYEKLPFNQLQPILSSANRLGGLVTQRSSHGRFALEIDEALIVRVNGFDAAYVGFQLADVWMVSADYVDRLGCLTRAQCVPDADGKITYVIARTDPGVHNWLDAGGLDTGGTTVRYQGLQSGHDDMSDAFETKLVKLADLDRVLPPDVKRVSPSEREQQLAARRAAYRRREDAVLRDE